LTTDRAQEKTLPFTGERFLPEVAGQIAFEHLHRYFFARSLVRGNRVLDVACGEGYGSDILATGDVGVVGVDISGEAVGHANQRYGRAGLRFVEASAAELPFPDASFDTVVSFETIEHHDLHQEMLGEIKRVLAPGGRLIISSPNRQYYSIEPGYSNPFHVKELFHEEFVALISQYFAHVMPFGQRVVHGSLIVRSSGGTASGGFRSCTLVNGAYEESDGLYKPLYDLVVASDGIVEDIGDSLYEATVHGLEPARFYGVHLPERVASADARILELEAAPGIAAEEVRQGFDSVRRSVEQALANSAELELLRREADRLHDTVTSLERDRAELASDVAVLKLHKDYADRDIESLKVQCEEAVRLAESMRRTTDSMERVEVGLQERLATTERALQQSQDYIESIHRSHSWRLTAWIRGFRRVFKDGKE